MRRDTQRFVIENIVRPIGLPIYWLLRSLYRLSFGWFDARASRASQRKFELEIRETLPFLFVSYSGAVVPNVGIPFPEPFDYATVTIASRHLLIRFIRGRGEFIVELAQSKNPSNWHDLNSVLTAINGRDEQPERRWVRDLQEAASLLEPNMTRLDEAFGVDIDGRVTSQLKEFDKADRASMRQWEFEINRRLQ